MNCAGPNPLIDIRNLEVRLSGRLVLSVDELEIFAGETLAVIGPNGAGKSTLLLSLARLLKDQSGVIRFAGEPITVLDELVYRRRIALVLQEPLLLDRLVFDNVAAPLRFRNLPKELVQERVSIWLEKLGISHLQNRKARELSGGEAQRASLARALAIEPELLLLDEPFSALDAPTRQILLQDMRALLAEHPVATVFVTHDQDEALIIGDRVAVFLDGCLRQIGSPSQVFSSPVDEEVAAFVGVETVLPGEVSNVSDDQVTVQVYGVPIYTVGQFEIMQPVLACLRPEDITLWREGELPTFNTRNHLNGVVVRLFPLGPLVRIEIACGKADQSDKARVINLVALVTRHSAEEMELAPGVDVTAAFKASAVHLIKR